MSKPDPRRTSSLTRDMLSKHGMWMIEVIRGTTVRRWMTCPSADIDDWAIIRAYPILPDLSEGPIPVSWEDISA